MTTHFTDERLEQLGNLYRSNPALHHSGITFVQFIQRPNHYLAELMAAEDADTEIDFEPLLPKQRQVSRNIHQRDVIADTVAKLNLDNGLQKDFPETCRHGDVVIAPIHRRRSPRRSQVGNHKTRRRPVFA